jgi:AraC-like DNA-binding protein
MPPALTVDLAPNTGFERHSHAHHQLAYASQGVLVMDVGTVAWVLPQTRALWIPAGIPHSVTADGDTRMSSVYIAPDRCPLAWSDPTVVDATGLLGELILYLSRVDLEQPERARAEALLWDLMMPIPAATLPLPMPRDERARRVAEQLLADVTDDRSLSEWGHTVGASERTLARLFVAETGLNFARWRTNARLAAALRLLANGTSTAVVAAQVGYGTPSAFVAAFRREIGTTPAEYFRAHSPTT